MPAPHPLLELYLDAAEGRFPPTDGGVTVLPPLAGGLECSVAFTAHAVVATALPQDRVRAWGPDGYGGSMAPDFLRRLAGPRGRVGDLDVTLVARGAGGVPALPPAAGLDGHHRVRHALGQRERVRVHADERGLVTVSAGLAGRWEFGVELHAPGEAKPAAGRELIRDALTLVPAGEPVFAAVSPGNARSLRSFLAVGFVPVGGEVVIHPARD